MSDRRECRHATDIGVAIGLGVCLSASVLASRSPGVRAAPADGNFVVNSTADTNARDKVLTLHEALMVANATGTATATGITLSGPAGR